MKCFLHIPAGVKFFFKNVIKGIKMDAIRTSGMPISYVNHTEARQIVDETLRNSRPKRFKDPNTDTIQAK